MEVYAERQRQQLYGEERKREVEQMRSKLTASHVLRDGEFNIDKKCSRPGFNWSTVTLDDYRRTFPATQQGKQYDEGYKTATGSDIPITYEGIPADTYQQTSTKEAFVDKGVSQKREYIGNDPTTNWPDMTPRLIKGHKLGQSEYSDLYIPSETDLKKPHYAKIRTANAKLPLPLDERKHKINVNLGSELAPIGGVSSEASSRYLQTNPKRYDDSGIRKMKEEMEWHSKVFREGDYNEHEGIKQTMFDIDYGKRPKAATVEPSEVNAEARLDASIQEKLHFMPQLIEHSMQADTARQEGEDGKKYHTNAHFNLGSDVDKSMSVYYKDFTPFKSQMKPDRIKPTDTKILTNHTAPNFSTSNRVDYYGTEGAAISLDNMAIRKSNMQKQVNQNINFTNTEDRGMQSVFTRDFRGPPTDYATMQPAKEKKCEFDFLESNGMLSDYKKKLTDKTENNDNFRGCAGVSNLVLNADKARVKSAAKRRLKSGRRAHFILGSNVPSYKTVTNDTFMGKPREDENVPAAGKVEKPSKDFSHFSMSDNTQDKVTDPHAPTNQESRTALDNYTYRKKHAELSPHVTVMRTDFMPIEERAYTIPQMKQMDAVAIRASKATAKTHFFHTDTSARNNYETTAMASFIKPEQMSGKVHLSSLH